MTPDAGAPSLKSRIHGCLLGGALGDSLGYAVEFDSIEAIRGRFGTAGVTDFAMLDGGSHFSDDTQMTLYTVDGLVEALEWANDGVGADVNACLWLAYLRWLCHPGRAGAVVGPGAAEALDRRQRGPPAPPRTPATPASAGWPPVKWERFTGP